MTGLVLALISSGQPGTYILNGSASQNTCNCYTLTPPSNNVSGSVWNANKIDLSVGFDFIFNVYLGCIDDNGADGIVFMLQPISTSVGTNGGGMGFEGVSPSVGVTVDTWQNTENNDPTYDHIAIQTNGNLSHGSDLAGPVQASSTSANIEDCQWHTLRVTWDPATNSLRSYFDGVLRVQAQNNIITTIFGGDPNVYWGFSAATGGSYNLQQFCTALNPQFSTNFANDATCAGSPVIFSNASESFAPIASYYWDFGDNTTDNTAAPPPHVYPDPGVYNVKLAIRGFDGCNSDTLRRTVSIGDYPVPGFLIFDTCTGQQPRIDDQSVVTIGTITQWNWTIDGTTLPSAPRPTLTNLGPGNHQLTLSVVSDHGCNSGAIDQVFDLKASPVITGNAIDGCAGSPIVFNGQQTDASTNIVTWTWAMPAGQTVNSQQTSYTFNAAGNYTASLTATADNGCTSNTATVPVFVNQSVAHAGNDTIIVQNQPYQLHGNGGVSYAWSPSIGLSDPAISDPITTLADDQTYTLTVTTAEGCVDEDDVHLTVFKGSAIYVPTGFTPNGDGTNDRLGPYYVGIREIGYFMLYNRWGELVFSSKNASSQWDGMFRGVKQPTGVYVWRLAAVDYVGKKYEMKGTTTLIR